MTTIGNSVQVQCAEVVGAWLGELMAERERVVARPAVVVA